MSDRLEDEFGSDVSRVLGELTTMLLAKNEAYGNSALEPSRIFSKADTIEQINVRIDDKLTRLAKGQKYDGDDDELDLLGYLVLRRIARKRVGDKDAGSLRVSPKVPETTALRGVGRPFGVGMSIDDAFGAQGLAFARNPVRS